MATPRQRRGKNTKLYKRAGKTVKKSKAHGRPSLYKPEYDDIAYGFGLLGASIEKLAQAIKIDRQTLYNWEEEHPSFFDKYHEGRYLADHGIARSLYDAAVGYSYKEETIKTDADGKVTKTITKKYQPPNIGAQKMILVNRQKEVWGNDPELPPPPVSNGGPTGDVIDISNLPGPVLKALEKAILDSQKKGKK